LKEFDTRGKIEVKIHWWVSSAQSGVKTEGPGGRYCRRGNTKIVRNEEEVLRKGHPPPAEQSTCGDGGGGIGRNAEKAVLLGYASPLQNSIKEQGGGRG